MAITPNSSNSILIINNNNNNNNNNIIIIIINNNNKLTALTTITIRIAPAKQQEQEKYSQFKRRSILRQLINFIFTLIYLISLNNSSGGTN
jgi:hypothetical protein